MVIKSLIWSNGERVNQSIGRWPGVPGSTVFCPNGCVYTKKDFIFFTKKFQKVSCSKQLLIIP